MSKGGILLKSGAAFIRFLQLLCAALILGIFSYFLAYLKHHDRSIPRWMKAVEGISGGAVIYTALAVLLVCFLGGITIFAALGLLLDLLFCGAFVAIAILARAGAKTCTGARSPLFNNRLRDCRFQKGAFAVAVAGAVLFLISAALGFLLNKHHKKEKKYGPGPSNNYTSGSGKKQPFWKRQRKSKTHDTELGVVEAGVAATEEKHHHHNKTVRPSHDTTVTDSTAAAPDVAYGGPNNKYQTLPTPEGNLVHPTNRSPHSTYTANVTSQPGYSQPGYSKEYSSAPVDKVIYDREPYAEVHHGGVPHREADTSLGR